MQRKLLAATVAAGPILALAFLAPESARAQTTEITTATTVPVATATAANGGPANITVTTAGAITLTTPGPMITLNSNNTVTTSGSLSSSGVSDSTGILVRGGNTGAVTVNAPISVISPLNPPDNDGDGDADGPFADGTGRYGIRVVGPGVFTGPITLNPGGALQISGNDSAGPSIETGMAGDLNVSGNINTTGDRGYGVRLNGPLTGNARIQGTVAVYGPDSVGVALDGDISGALVLQGGVSATGYRYTQRPVLETDRKRLDSDDNLIGGPAVRISGNVGGGVIFDIAPTVNADVADTDGDGIPDIQEGIATITSYGSAPGVVVGSATRATSLGVVGTGNNAYGFVNRGSITTDGVFDGVSATGVQLGAGGAVAIANGIHNSGTINATAYSANATGMVLNAGVSAPAIVNLGALNASTTSDGVNTVRGLSIQAGATVTSLTNSGTIVAGVNGARANAIAIEDLAGGIRRIDNTGTISAGVNNVSGAAVTSTRTAVDARANTAGLTIRQDGTVGTISTADTDKDGVDDALEPVLNGDVFFGSGADRLELANGSFNGAAHFGAGADSLVISGGAFMAGALTDSDGRLTISLDKGALAILNAETIRATSLNVTSADSQLLFAADPVNRSATQLLVGTASIADKAQVSMTLSSILDAPTRYTVIKAGSLTAGTLTSSLTGSPYFYVSSATANTAAGEVYVDVRPRTATELGFNGTQTQAYSSIIQALKNDVELSRPLLVQTGRDGLVHLYNQLLPDLGGGTFDALAYSVEQIAEGIGQRPDPYERYGPDSFWAQEVNSLVRTETEDVMGSDTQVFGFAGGYEAMGEFGGALGVAVAYLNVQERDNAAQVGERTTTSAVQGDIYWRRSVGGLRLSLGGGGGYGWMTGDRRFFSGDLNGDGLNDLARENSASWNSLMGHAFASVGYEQGFGRYYLRPEGRLSYFYLREGERKESGGGAGFDVTTEDRSSSALNAIAGLTFGASFGRDLWWRPEVRVGYRQQIAGSIGDTVAQFAGGTPFTLASADNKEGAVTLDMALRAGTPMSYVAVEGGVAAAKRQKRYNVRLAGRMMF